MNKLFIVQVDPESISLYPGEKAKIQLNLTVPYLCTFPSNTTCIPMQMELYMQNNRKPMCQHKNKIVGVPLSGEDHCESKCFSPVQAVDEVDNMTQLGLQFTVFNIEAATTSLFTGRSYLVLANFKPMGIINHKIWEGYRPVPLQVTFLYIICVLMLKWLCSYFGRREDLSFMTEALKFLLIFLTVIVLVTPI